MLIEVAQIFALRSLNDGFMNASHTAHFPDKAHTASRLPRGNRLAPSAKSECFRLSATCAVSLRGGTSGYSLRVAPHFLGFRPLVCSALTVLLTHPPPEQRTEPHFLRPTTDQKPGWSYLHRGSPKRFSLNIPSTRDRARCGQPEKKTAIRTGPYGVPCIAPDQDGPADNRRHG